MRKSGSPIEATYGSGASTVFAPMIQPCLYKGIDFPWRQHYRFCVILRVFANGKADKTFNMFKLASISIVRYLCIARPCNVYSVWFHYEMHRAHAMYFINFKQHHLTWSYFSEHSVLDIRRSGCSINSAVISNTAEILVASRFQDRSALFILEKRLVFPITKREEARGISSVAGCFVNSPNSLKSRALESASISVRESAQSISSGPLCNPLGNAMLGRGRERYRRGYDVVKTAMSQTPPVAKLSSVPIRIIELASGGGRGVDKRRKKRPRRDKVGS